MQCAGWQHDDLNVYYRRVHADYIPGRMRTQGRLHYAGLDIPPLYLARITGLRSGDTFFFVTRAILRSIPGREMTFRQFRPGKESYVRPVYVNPV